MSEHSTHTPSGRSALQDQRPADLRMLLSFLWAQKWIVIATVVVVGGLVSAWTMRQPRVYEASCSLEYDPTPPRPLGTKVEDVASPMLSIYANREFYETQNRIIASRVVAEMVVRRLGLHRDAEYMGIAADQRPGWQGVTVDQAAERVRSNLTVEQVRDTRLVFVKVRDTDPERAQRIANAIADAYIEKTLDDRTSSTVSAVEWLGAQVDDLQGDLRQADAALHAFKAEHDVLSLSMEDRQNLIANEMELMSRAMGEARVRRIELQSRVRELRAAVTADPLTHASPAMRGLVTIESLTAQLRLKTAEQESLRTRYGVEHPRMAALTQEIAQIRADLRGEVEAVLASAEAELREVRSTEAGLQTALQQANERGIELNRWEMEYSHLVRERDSKAALYDLVLKRSSETDLTRMLRITHVRMVDRALVPRLAVAPRVTTNVSIGLAAGLALGVFLAFLLERSDRRIRTVEDVEAQGVTVLGMIPRIAGSAAGGPRRRRRQVAEGAEGDLVAHREPMSAIAENFRTVRTNLAFMGGDGKLGAFAVTSPSPRDGKSTVVLNLAITLAQSGKKVVVVDTDLRRPRLHRALKVSSARGITTCLAGEAEPLDVVVSTVVPGLDIVPCGPIPPNPSELLYTERYRSFLRTLRENYDHVIFDSPPIGAVTDAVVLSAQLDGVIVVVKAKSTTRDGLRVTIRQLRDVEARIVGVIVNDVDGASGGYGGGYYYRKAGYYTSDEAPASADVSDAKP